MTQIRVVDPNDVQKRVFLKQCGFHWCTKHRRYERNSGRIDEKLLSLFRDKGMEVTVSDGEN